MKIKIAWLYHDFMDLYGDKGNILTLKKRAEDRGIEFDLHTVGICQEEDLSDYDLVFLGGGADKEQKALIPDLLARKDNIQKAMEEKTFFLLICGGYQLFGSITSPRTTPRFPVWASFRITPIPAKPKAAASETSSSTLISMDGRCAWSALKTMAARHSTCQHH